MICAQCGDTSTTARCTSCGAEPLLSGRYRLESCIGRGGHGTVYRGTDLDDGGLVAVKEVHLGAGVKADQLALREVAVLQQLSHPAVPAYLDHVIAGHGRGRALFVVQRFVDGPSLAEELATRRYDEDEVLTLIDELCEVLGYLHRRSPPVIHRDLKPSNVMRGPEGLVLVDFGAVRDVLRSVSGGSTVAGTFGFMAPEQFRGVATPATDVFGLGALAVALLSRRDPASLHDRLGRFAWEDHVRVSPPVRDLLRWMTSADPNARPQGVDELRGGLLVARRGQRVEAELAELAESRAEAVMVIDGDQVARLLHEGPPVAQLPVVRSPESLARRRRAALVAVSSLGVMASGATVALLALTQAPMGMLAASSSITRTPLARVASGTLELRLPLEEAPDHLVAGELTITWPDGEELVVTMPDTLPHSANTDYPLALQGVRHASLDGDTLVLSLSGDVPAWVEVSGTGVGEARLEVLREGRVDWFGEPIGHLGPPPGAQASADCILWWMYDERGNHQGLNVSGCSDAYQERVISDAREWSLAGPPDDGQPGYMRLPWSL